MIDGGDLRMKKLVFLVVLVLAFGCSRSPSDRIERNLAKAYELTEKGETAEAFDLLLEAQSWINDDVPPAVRAKFYMAITAPYYNSYNIGDSKVYAEKALEAAREADSLQWLPNLLWNLGLTMTNVDSVESLLKECRDLSDRYGFSYSAGRSRIFLSKMSTLKGDTEEAERILDSVAANPELALNNEIDLHFQRALIYEHQGKNIEAMRALDSIQSGELSLDGKGNLYQMRYQISRSSGRIEEALLYRDSLAICQDSVNKIKSSEILTAAESDYSKRMIREEAKQRLFWWISGAVLVLMIGVVIFLIKSRAMKMKQLKLIERISQLNARLVEFESRGEEEKADTLLPIMEKFRLTREFYFTLQQSDLVGILNMTPNPDDIPKEKLKIMMDSVIGTFAEACANLRQAEKDVTQDDAWLCVCSYIGLNKDVTAAVMKSSDDALRKRKSRVKQKLPAELFDLFFSK